MLPPAVFAPLSGLLSHTTDAIIAQTFARLTDPAALAGQDRYPFTPDAPAVGQRIRLKRDARMWGVTVPKGSTGTVTESLADEIAGYIAVRLDTRVAGLTDADGVEVMWTGADDLLHTPDDGDGYAARPFWLACARIVDPANLNTLEAR